MGLKLKRKLLRMGQSYAITLPPAWVNYHGARADEVTIIGNDVLVIAPAGYEQQAENIIRDIERSQETSTKTINKEVQTGGS